MENHVGDLWTIMEFLNPGLLGTAEHVPQARSSSRSRPAATPTAPALQRLTGPFILRRLKTDKSIIADLPEKHGDEGLLHSDEGAGVALRGRRQGRRPSEIEAAEGIQRKGLILATLSKLQAGVQSPGAVPGRQLARSRAAAASWRG